jgi:hypothetical protein
VAASATDDEKLILKSLQCAFFDEDTKSDKLAHFYLLVLKN